MNYRTQDKIGLEWATRLGSVAALAILCERRLPNITTEERIPMSCSASLLKSQLIKFANVEVTAVDPTGGNTKHLRTTVVDLEFVVGTFHPTTQQERLLTNLPAVCTMRDYPSRTMRAFGILRNHDRFSDHGQASQSNNISVDDIVGHHSDGRHIHNLHSALA